MHFYSSNVFVAVTFTEQTISFVKKSNQICSCSPYFIRLRHFEIRALAIDNWLLKRTIGWMYCLKIGLSMVFISYSLQIIGLFLSTIIILQLLWLQKKNEYIILNMIELSCNSKVNSDFQMQITLLCKIR